MLILGCNTGFMWVYEKVLFMKLKGNKMLNFLTMDMIFCVLNMLGCVANVFPRLCFGLH